MRWIVSQTRVNSVVWQTLKLDSLLLSVSIIMCRTGHAGRWLRGEFQIDDLFESRYNINADLQLLLTSECIRHIYLLLFMIETTVHFSKVTVSHSIIFSFGLLNRKLTQATFKHILIIDSHQNNLLLFASGTRNAACSFCAFFQLLAAAQSNV